jgi:hypothetical protein
MPTPIIPKRTLSLATVGLAGAGIGSGLRRMLLAANDPPAAAALISRNSRRETLLFGMASPGLTFSSDQRVSLTFTRHQEYPFLDDFARAGFVVPLMTGCDDHRLVCRLGLVLGAASRYAGATAPRFNN